MQKMDSYASFKLEKRLPKPILHLFGPTYSDFRVKIWTKIVLIYRPKTPILTKNTDKFDFFEFYRFLVGLRCTKTNFYQRQLVLTTLEPLPDLLGPPMYIFLIFSQKEGFWPLKSRF